AVPALQDHHLLLGMSVGGMRRLAGLQYESAGDELGRGRRVSEKVDAVGADQLALVLELHRLELVKVDGLGVDLPRLCASEGQLAKRPSRSENQCQSCYSPSLRKLHGEVSASDEKWIRGAC